MPDHDHAEPRHAETGAIEVAHAPDGSLLYLVPGTPADLPLVRARDLLAAWDAARHLAGHGAWGVPRRFRFRAGGTPIDIALADLDAGCWAEAVDARTGLQTRYGLSLCLRLLALVELLTRSPAARRLVTMAAGEADIDPRLAAAASRARLEPDARFDERRLLAGREGACELLTSQAGSTP